MIRKDFGDVAYYFYSREHLDMAEKAKSEAFSGYSAYMQFAHISVHLVDNSLLKCRVPVTDLANAYTKQQNAVEVTW